MNIQEEIKAAIKEGIYMDFKNQTEKEKFFKELFEFLIDKKNFCVFKDKGHTIVVSSDIEDICEIFIHVDTLKIVPFSSHGFFKIFMDMLEFIAKKYQKEQTGTTLKVPTPKPSDPEGDESTEEDLWL